MCAVLHIAHYLCLYNCTLCTYLPRHLWVTGWARTLGAFIHAHVVGGCGWGTLCSTRVLLHAVALCHMHVMCCVSHSAPHAWPSLEGMHGPRLRREAGGRDGVTCVLVPSWHDDGVVFLCRCGTCPWCMECSHACWQHAVVGYVESVRSFSFVTTSASDWVTSLCFN